MERNAAITPTGRRICFHIRTPIFVKQSANSLIRLLRQVPVVRPAVTETTALGAAYLAGLAASYWRNAQEISAQWRAERRFEPQMTRAGVEALRERWSTALDRAKVWEPR